MPDDFSKEVLASLIDAEALYDQAPCGYLSFSADGTVLKINQTLLTWLGYRADEVIFQKNFSEFLSKGGQIHYEMFFRPMLNVSGTVKELSYELAKRDGTTFHVLFSAVAIRNAQNAILAVNAIITDNTHRKHYEREILKAKKLAEEEKRTFQFLADLIPEMIWTADAAGEIDYINERFIHYFALPDKVFSVNRILTKIQPDDRKRFIASWAESLLSVNDLHIELQLQNSSGQYEWHAVKAVPYLNEGRELVKWFGSCTNIDVHKRALKQKDEFISIASHELKTPITSLMGALQLLDRMKNDPSPKMLPSLIERANKNVKKVNTLVGDLLNVSQLNAGQLHLNKARFKLGPMIFNCCEHILAEGRFEILIEGDDSLEAFADQTRIEQVVINFINNAVKYAPASKQIFIAYTAGQGFAKISVADKGPGIPKDKLQHLFDRYYRVDSAGSQYSGLGLGLYICAEIIQRHSGEIGVDSQLGEGSTFWFTLPCSS
ncbi:PAS domain-containing protein [Mucilaginibacter sp. ZT4R22]|uniref:histidine kinase n=1 Tax=Mucilaginibacter pankratovii TaxID=2772110 RepID=A0ABR7WV16_9SPHI|nr:PAS domain-containing sensor histidine kinase [Mucilaginibacter pankratovii]MBD1366144.1 PAS domain-containing protein [Mucilaginibacter pankratovii]